MRKVIRFQTIEDIEEFVKICASHTTVSVDVKSGKYVVDGKSLLGVLALGIGKDLLVDIAHKDDTILEDLQKFNIKDF